MSPAAKRRQRRRLKIEALQRDNDQLRRILAEVLDDGAQDCDGLNPNPDIDPAPHCHCSTARARRVLAGEPEWPEDAGDPHPREVGRVDVVLKVDMPEWCQPTDKARRA